MTASITNAGGRNDNQNACHRCADCWVVADGLHGQAGGGLAARIAVHSVLATSASNTGPEMIGIHGRLCRSRCASPKSVSTQSASSKSVSTIPDSAVSK